MSPLPQLRERAASRFEALGWPSARSESWRYFKVRDLREGGFTPGSPAPSPADSLPAALDGADRIVVINGRTASGPTERDGLTIGPLGDSRRHFDGTSQLLDDAAMVALNTQHFVDGIAIRAPKDAVSERPLEIVLLNVAAGPTPAMASPRIFIEAGRNSQLDVVFRFVSGTPQDGPALTNALIHVVATDGARVRTATVCDEAANTMHIHTTLVELGRDAHYASHVVMRGAAADRSEIRVRLADQGASCDLRGLYVADGKQVHDNYTQIEHLAPHTSSNELYRGIIEDRATGTFQGRVLIHEGARVSEAHQLNNNLLLGDAAVANAKPQLEIDNDDVVASHGSTVGQLDDDALFYLQSRGLSYEHARGLLTYAFASEVLDGMASTTLAEQLGRELEEELSGGTEHASWPTEL